MKTYTSVKVFVGGVGIRATAGEHVEQRASNGPNIRLCRDPGEEEGTERTRLKRETRRDTKNVKRYQRFGVNKK